MSAYPMLPSSRRLAVGVTLIELMVALVLGLIVTGAALTLFLTNKQTYTASESLGRVQETARTAFDLMTRDVREAAGNPCDNSIVFNNVLNPSALWWANWDNGVRGYGATTAFPDDAFGTTTGKRVSGTEAIEVKTLAPTDSVLTTAMATTSADIVVNSTTGIAAGDIVGICEYGHTAGGTVLAHGNIFQVTSPAGSKLTHTATGTPGNIDGSLASSVYPVGAFIAKYRATRWYVGYNSRGGKSLFQTSLQNTTGVPGLVKNEIAEGVDNMSFMYLLDGGVDYVAWSSTIDWSSVAAIRVTLTLSGQDQVGTDGAVLQRTIEHVITLRNKAP